MNKNPETWPDAYRHLLDLGLNSSEANRALDAARNLGVYSIGGLHIHYSECNDSFTLFTERH